MKKRVALGLVLFSLIVMPIVFALDTQIDVLSKSDRMVTVRFMDDKGTLEGGAFIDQLLDESDKVSVVFSSDTHNYVKVSVMTRDSAGGLIKFADGTSSKTFYDVKTGWIYNIDLTQQDPTIVQVSKIGVEVVEEVVEETIEVVEEASVEETVEVVEETVEAPITGDVIGDGKKINVKLFGYFAGLVFAIVIIMFVLFTMKKNKSKGVKSAVKIKEKDDIIDEDLELQDAERRIKEAEEEIKDIRSKKFKLKEAEDALKKDKENLEKLRKEAGQ
jgi:hypothetical protein